MRSDVKRHDDDDDATMKFQMNREATRRQSFTPERARRRMCVYVAVERNYLRQLSGDVPMPLLITVVIGRGVFDLLAAHNRIGCPGYADACNTHGLRTWIPNERSSCLPAKACLLELEEYEAAEQKKQKKIRYSFRSMK